MNDGGNESEKVDWRDERDVVSGRKVNIRNGRMKETAVGVKIGR